MAIEHIHHPISLPLETDYLLSCPMAMFVKFVCFCLCMYVFRFSRSRVSLHEFRLFSHWYPEKNHLSPLCCTLSLYSPHMASVERKQEKHEPFYLGYGSKRQTSAEIVTEARHSLRTLPTQRPFTPQEEHRQLFGGSAHTCDGRPPSSFRFWEKNKHPSPNLLWVCY